MMMTNRTRWLLGGAAVGMGLLAWSFFGEPDLTAQQAPGWSPALVTMPSPAGSNSGEPQLTVSARGVLLSWVEHNGVQGSINMATEPAPGWSGPPLGASADQRRRVLFQHARWRLRVP
jgi:hypothetical protein